MCCFAEDEVKSFRRYESLLKDWLSQIGIEIESCLDYKDVSWDSQEMVLHLIINHK